MDSTISRQLVDKMYEKRKAAALELEKQVRECHLQNDQRRITSIIDQLVDMFSNTSNPLHVRNGGLIGLAGTAIALGVDVSPYMSKFIEPLLLCFTDTENRIRYFSAECLYNIAKVSKAEILMYFNPIFDSLSKLAADSELSVKNGAELLDRLLKDIVAESASFYVPQNSQREKLPHPSEQGLGIMVPPPTDVQTFPSDFPQPRRVFSLAQFIPLLSDRIYVVSPFSRSFLVSWITVMDSVPELELISYLPEFFDGLLKYLSDPTEDVRVATENLLGDFLREIRDISLINKGRENRIRQQNEALNMNTNNQADGKKAESLDSTSGHPERIGFVAEGDTVSMPDSDYKEGLIVDTVYREVGAWSPGQGVEVNHAAIVEILLQQLDSRHDEIQQSTALQWLAEFIGFAQDVMIPFTHRLIPVILPNLAHHVPMIQAAALRTNQALLHVIQGLPSPLSGQLQSNEAESISSSRTGRSPPPSTSPAPSRQSTGSKEPTSPTVPKDNISTDVLSDVNMSPASDRTAVPSVRRTTISASTVSSSEVTATEGAAIINKMSYSSSPMPQDTDLFDYQATVNILTFQFLSEHEETRIAALKWLIMLHQKAPKKILAMDDGTFPALLKTLSDSSEDVIKHDLQLLAQISSSSEEGYFKSFMVNLLELFSTDRRLLETRGSLIIRQLCLNLNTERIYRTLAEILEKEEDLEFASDMIQKLNIILITSPELADFRRRLKSLETRQDGQALFATLYRSWCHNAVAVFALCLLAQAYEHASSLLSIFADLEITVQLLIQVDKLVQLIESPVFTYIRLQLLEPEKYPYLFKSLYGLLMILPQSSAFVSLRNRLNAVNSAGFLHIAPRSASTTFSGRSKIGRGDDIKWQELLTHFRSLQLRHEKARRQALGLEGSSLSFPSMEEKMISSGSTTNTPGPSRPPARRKVTGDGFPASTGVSSRGGPTLSPLNPKARGTSGFLTFSQQSATGNSRPKSPVQPTQKGRRTFSIGPKA